MKQVASVIGEAPHCCQRDGGTTQKAQLPDFRRRHIAVKGVGMKRLWNHWIVKNSWGQVRSGWILSAVSVVFFGIRYMIPRVTAELLRNFFIFTGGFDPATDKASDLVVWVNDVGLTVIFQMITELFMIGIPILTWKFLMKKKMREMGFRTGTPGRKEGLVGLALGAFSCTAVFLVLITAGGGQVMSWTPRFSLLIFLWIIAFLLVALGEETFTRGFFMSTLRRTRCSYCIMLLPSVIFASIHLFNPNVTFFSVVNIVLIGLIFSYMYYKSGNLRMCIGYHFAWNVFQGCVFGINVSGMEIPGMLTTQFPHGNSLNGGVFGMEGGVLTTASALLGLLFVWFYYRNSSYDFIRDIDSIQEK